MGLSRIVIMKTGSVRRVKTEMTRSEFIRSLSDEELALYLYINKKHTSLGLRRLTEWLAEELKTREDK